MSYLVEVHAHTTLPVLAEVYTKSSTFSSLLFFSIHSEPQFVDSNDTTQITAIGCNSRAFWIWLLCLIAYISHTHQHHSSLVVVHLQCHPVVANSRRYLYLSKRKASRATYHCDGWGSSRVLVVGGLLVESLPSRQKIESPFWLSVVIIATCDRLAKRALSFSCLGSHLCNHFYRINAELHRECAGQFESSYSCWTVPELLFLWYNSASHSQQLPESIPIYMQYPPTASNTRQEAFTQ